MRRPATRSDDAKLRSTCRSTSPVPDGPRPLMTPPPEPWPLSPPLPRLLLAVLVLLPLLSGGTVHAQSVIDVAVFYTGEARADEGGTDAIKAKIDEIVAATNMAYADSGVNQTINLVHVREVTYTESDSLATDLSNLRDPSDGSMDHIHATRDLVWADIVMLLLSEADADGVAGKAFSMTGLSTDLRRLCFWRFHRPRWHFHARTGPHHGACPRPI